MSYEEYQAKVAAAQERDREFRRIPLKTEEISFLMKGRECQACGHNLLLHNHHCCTYCTVPGCRCSDGALQAEPHPDNAPSPRHINQDGA